MGVSGCLLPFSRNYMNYNGGGRPHEFYLWPDVTAAAYRAYSLRYMLLSYIYSTFFLVNQQGGTVARPLLFTDPTDLNARWVAGNCSGYVMYLVC